MPRPCRVFCDRAGDLISLGQHGAEAEIPALSLQKSAGTRTGHPLEQLVIERGGPAPRLPRSLRFFRKGRVLVQRGPRFSRHHGDLAVGLARWPYDDFHVLPERREEVHEALDGKSAGAVAH